MLKFSIYKAENNTYSQLSAPLDSQQQTENTISIYFKKSV